MPLRKFNRTRTLAELSIALIGLGDALHERFHMLSHLLTLLGAAAACSLGFNIVSRARPKRNFNSKKLSGQNYPTAPALQVVATIVALKARLTFSQPVVVSSLPIEITRQAAGAGPQLPPTSYTVVSPTVVDLGYAANVVVTDKLTIPAGVPEIKGITGGQTQASVTTF